MWAAQDSTPHLGESSRPTPCRFLSADELLFAVVGDDGTLVASRGVTPVSHTGPGNCTLAVTRDVSACAVVAATGGYPTGPSSTTGVDAGQAGALVLGTAAPRSMQIGVLTKDSVGGSTDRKFHLAVVC